MIVDDEDIIVSGLVKVMPWANMAAKWRLPRPMKHGAGRAAEKRPDILFTDICMPGADGLMLLAAVRSEFLDMLVTILSGFPDFEYAQRAIGLGVVRWRTCKPSKMHELEEALAVMVEKPGRRARVPARCAVCENAQNFIIKKVQYIEQHYAEKTDAARRGGQGLTSASGTSLSSLPRTRDRVFRPALNGVRIAKAKELLADPAPQGLGSERRGWALRM